MGNGADLSTLGNGVLNSNSKRGKKNPLHEHSILVGKVIPHMARG